MPIDETIARAHADLLHRLGAAACVVPVPAAGAEPMLEVGAIGPVPCWSMRATPAEAHQVARRLARRGLVGLLLADHPEADRRALAITLAPVRTAVVGCADDRALALVRLARVHPDESLLGTAVQLADALDVDAAGRRAFRILRSALDATVAALPACRASDQRHEWALLQLTRLLFLRFVESEGWLDGDPTYLRIRFDACLAARRDPGRHLFRPLFFGTLNRPPTERTAGARHLGRIPYLNGGLFEPHPLERGEWPLDAEGWQRLAAPVLEQIEVALEGDGADGRVTPELLGRVFEGVMHPDERAAAGAFYTPPVLVEAMVRDAVAAHLAHRLDRREASVHAALADPDPVLRAAMLDCRVLDPAVGSGAFLLGALRCLHGPGPLEPRRLGLLVARRLHGIDRDPAAVRISELRLWLELLRGVRGRPIERLRPLPTLDAVMRSGDALLDPLLTGSLLPRDRAPLAALGRSLAAAHGTTARRAARRARVNAERDAVVRALAAREASLAAAMRDGDVPERTLFGESTQRPRWGAHRARLAREQQAIRATIRRVERDRDGVPFVAEAAFAGVRARGGFDLVVGNPPWVRAERLPAVTRDALTARYQWWRGTGDGWRHRPDLAVAFLERSLEWLAPNGTLALLVPAKLATADYAVRARAELAERTTMHCVADLQDDPRAGFEAAVYPMALIASRRAAVADHVVRNGLGSSEATRQQAHWRGGVPWVARTSAHVERICRHLAATHPMLGQRFQPSLGIKTGANEAFLAPPTALHAYTRPAVRGRDVRDGQVRETVGLLWPADARGAAWPTLPPPVAAHLARFRERLESRADARSSRCWWSLFRTRPATAPHRVVWPDVARTLDTVVLTGRTVPLNSCYVIAAATDSEARALAAYLRTPLMTAIARLSAEPARGGFARFGARVVRHLPLPAAATRDATLIAAGDRPADLDRARAAMARVAELLTLDRTDVDRLLAADRG